MTRNEMIEALAQDAADGMTEKELRETVFDNYCLVYDDFDDETLQEIYNEMAGNKRETR